MNIYQHKLYKITEIKKQNHDNLLFSIDCNLNPQPGQFVEVNIPSLGEAPISTASFNNKQLDLNVRIVGNVTYAMSKWKKNQMISLRGPYGKGFPMEKFFGNNVILIGGGCGVAPLKGVIDYLDKHRDKYKEITMFFGYRSPKDVLFKHHIKDWEEKYIYNMTVDKNPEHLELGCPTGFVTKLLDDYKMDNSNKIALICGPEIMMRTSVEILKKKGFNDDQIFVSYERHMKCCTGRCGHCMIKGTYVCKDGPVFRWDFAKGLKE